jgi:hypothetical protein
MSNERITYLIKFHTEEEVAEAGWFFTFTNGADWIGPYPSRELADAFARHAVEKTIAELALEALGLN